MKTTKKQFDIFKKEARRWILFWGLTDYRIEFFHEDIGKNRGETTDYDNMMCCDIKFPTELHKTTGENEIRMTAFHEVCEVMLMRLRTLADEYYAFRIVDKEVHTIIRRLENNVFKPKKHET